MHSDPENFSDNNDDMTLQPIGSAELIDHIGFEMGCDLQETSFRSTKVGLTAAVWRQGQVAPVQIPTLGVHLFCLCLHGHGRLHRSNKVLTGDADIELMPDSCFFVPKGTQLNLSQSGETMMLHIMLESEPMVEAIKALGFDNADDLALSGWSGIFDPSLQATALMILAQLLQGQLDAGDFSKALARAMALQIVKRTYGNPLQSDEQAHPGFSNAVIDKMIEYLHRNLAHPVGLADLVKITERSEPEITRVFQVRFANDVPGYLEKARVLRALPMKNIMLEDDVKIASVCGFPSIADMHDATNRVMEKYSLSAQTSSVH